MQGNVRSIVRSIANSIENGGDDIARKWANAVHNKVFTSSSYTFQLPDGNVLQDGGLLDFGVEMTMGTRDVDVMAKIRQVLEQGPATVFAHWEVPALHFDFKRFVTLFEFSETLDCLYFVNEQWKPMFVLKKEALSHTELQLAACTGVTHAVNVQEHWIADSDGRAVRLYDEQIDPVYHLLRRDVFVTEADFLRVYGTVETIIPRNDPVPGRRYCVCM
jgi:hypothetical protein